MDFNNKLADMSDGLLPKFGDAYRGKYASLAGFIDIIKNLGLFWAAVMNFA